MTTERILSEQLQRRLDSLPIEPGVYLMKNARNQILYVGKAVNLKNRVRSYFQSGRGHSPKVRALVSQISDLEIITTRNEVEALVLESNLIKHHQPYYNALLKDDKSYPFLKLTTHENFPRLLVVRERHNDGARYFGPYAGASAIRETLAIVNRHFQLRTGTDSVMANRRRPCLQYQIKRCPAPCVYSVPQEEYRRSVDEVALFLEGKADELTGQLTGRMKDASGKLEFERAAQLRELDRRGPDAARAGVHEHD